MTQNAPCKYFAKVRTPPCRPSQLESNALHFVAPITRTESLANVLQGSCKFGQGCALAHILPDGRVINRPPRGQPFAYARRTHLPQAPPPGPPSLLSMQAHDLSAHQDFPFPGHGVDDPLQPHYNPQPLLGVPPLDGPAATFGSPPHDGRLGASPSGRGLSVLDAPLPSSFDSQGISHAARHGPFASSVPPRFGIESPPSSLPNKPFQSSNMKLRGLHGSPFGDAANLDGVLHGAGSSPPSFDEPLSFSKRPLHSERLARPRMMMSSSLGTRPYLYQQEESASDESDDDGIGEDLLPSSLHELLPQEKLRRFSRNVPEDDGSSSFLSAQRRAISSGNPSQDIKLGSLSPHSASPSRYNALWSSRSLTKADPDVTSPSAFGHVGSPLRPSALRSSSLVNVSGGDMSPYAVGSPPKQASMSMLTQELQRTKLGEHSKPVGASRSLSSGSNTAGRNGLIERGISSNSLGRETIEEEQGLFSMEEEESEPSSSVNFAAKPVGPIGTK